MSSGQAELTFPGDGEMARRMREYPWAGSPLGDPGNWPSSLRTAVRICLTSRFPMIVWWGEDLRFFYNDAYLPLLGNKHPALMQPGDQVWGEIWDTIGPMLDSVMRTGQATWSEDLLLPMDRHGYWEETYWTYSYSPLHDDNGIVRGVFTAVKETTEEVVGRRRLAALQDLGALAGQARSVAEACALVVRSLEGAADVVPFAAVYLRGPDGSPVLAGSSVPGAGLSPVPGGPGGWPAGEVLRDGRPVTLTDVIARFGELPSGGWKTPPAEAMVLPLTGGADGAAAGAIVLAASAGRALDEAYASFLGLVAQQTAAIVNRALAYQAQLRRAEELAELDRAKTTFFANVSHEFRTPLTLIMGPLEELRARIDPADTVAAGELDVIYRNGVRLGKLVNTLLDFSRLEAGRMQASFEPLDLGAFTTELASVFESAFERAGIGYEVDCPPLSAPVYVDREMWEKVVFNLLSNALKFTFEGTVGVRLGEEDGHAVLRVADTGTGIPAAELPRLFDRFHRIENMPSRSNEGSGIGLALVRELVGLHGGTIAAASTGQASTGQASTGQAGSGRAGTTFTIELPFGREHLADDNVTAPGGPRAVAAAARPFLLEAMRWLPADSPATAGASAALAATAAPASGGRRDADGKAALARVLLADDNADMREYLQRLLEPAYQVTAVTDGQAAIEAARASPPDIVISDVMMPRLGGLQLVAALRADLRTAEVPVLLLSARAGQEAAIEGLEAGADDYLVKPFAAAELLARVRANVELARLRTHHARWRTALLDSLHEAFYLVDEDGAVVEINAGFTDLLGFGPEGLPYPLKRPWWPDEQADPEGHQLATEALARLMTDSTGGFTVPLRHRDGRRVWVTGAFNEVTDPENGHRMVVGTFRDITAEHYAVQREAALGALSLVVSRAGSAAQVMREALDELARLWRSPEVTAVTWTGTDPVTVTSTGSARSWEALPAGLRDALAGLRSQPVLTPVASRTASPPGVGIRLEHPAGALGIWIELGSGRVLTAEDRTLLSLVGGYLGQALHRAYQADQQRETALALQRAILGPSRLPAGFGVRYEPASRPLEVGGDWYDIVELPDGRIGIMVGDCVGHDLGAATVMGQLSSACRALLLQDASAGAALTAMDRFASFVPGGECATVFCGILDPGTGELRYSSAGHPPGIVVHPGGRMDLLEGARALPLAIRADAGRTEASYVLPPRSTLLLYTDGLVERRGRPITEGIAAAAAAIREADQVPLGDLAEQIMTGLAPAGGYEDDVALVLYHHPAPLDVSFSAESDQLASVRAQLRGWLRNSGVGTRIAQDVLVAAGEAIANAIEHGHRHHPAEQVRLRAVSTANQLRVTVTDRGRWRATPPGDRSLRGHGIALMRALMQQVTIEPGPFGTTVDLYMGISHGHLA
jgi:PAS domain S-box-containing protein